MQLPFPTNMPSKGLTDPARAMPEEYLDKLAVVSYRNYYMGAKDHLAEYTRRTPPSWWKGSWVEKENKWKLYEM